MKMKTLFWAALMLNVCLISSCAHIFSSRYQKVTIQSTTPGAKIIHPSTGVTEKNGMVKYDKMRIYHTVRLEKEGFKTTNYSFALAKRSPSFAFAILDLAVPFYGWFYGIQIDLFSPKTRKFDSKQNVPALVAYDKRKDDEKFMIINNTAMDIKGKDINWHQYIGMNNYKNGKHHDTKAVRRHNRSKDREDLEVDNSVFTSELNRSLKKMNFIDTTNTIFPAIGNTVYLNATVKKVTIHDVDSRIGRSSKARTKNVFPNDLIAVELEIEWEVLDYYKQKIYNTRTTQKSDLYTFNFSERQEGFDNVLRKAMGDNLEYSILKIRKELSEKGLLKTSGAATENVLAPISIARPAKIENSRLNDYLKSVVIIKVDDGHGSGVVVSGDGYIVTAYHVVAGSKKMEVIFSDGTKSEAELIRKNENADLALVKVDKKELLPLPISQTTDPEIGIDVWAIGAPKSIELGQSVSKGVLSGLRKANNVSYLQTDVSLNGGNSGGPLVNKDGLVLGIVTAKLIGVGTEGVGFAISSEEVFSKLKLQYQ